jgi:hypothetical protein
MKIDKQTSKLKVELEKIQANFTEQLSRIESDLFALTSYADEITSLWQGKWFNDSFNKYKDPSKKQSKIFSLSADDILEYSLHNTKINIGHINNELQGILKVCQVYNEKLLIELSPIKTDPQYSEQVKILNKLDNYEWGFPDIKFIEHKKPNRFIGDYHTAAKLINEGYDIPPHISYGARIMSLGTELMAINDFLKLAYRILRELELSTNINETETSSGNQSFILLETLINRFHDVSRQLVDRYSNRETININDEYDVQDLFHALLKIHFTDIRTEDSVPSFAGRNTRLDFLLKNEEIAIEIKKTRNNLNDKDIGDELLQDIARYKNHPYCKYLYCFVYDPQGLISNPRGLESDLNSESNEKLQVIVMIRP